METPFGLTSKRPKRNRRVTWNVRSCSPNYSRGQHETFSEARHLLAAKDV